MFSKEYFSTVTANIVNNINLRKPQEYAYIHAYNHFIKKQSTEHALIVLPTGVGKTGLMAILPYGISSGRVLIITPGKVVRDNIIKQLDTSSPDCFLYEHKIIPDLAYMPKVSVYEGDKTPVEVLRKSNIVVVNIQKLQDRLDSSLLNRLEADFFDMIIVDEAHHSVAPTWITTAEHFSEAKFIKVTGTPERTDGQKINASLVYNYKLSSAMHDGLIKSLRNFEFLPEEVELIHEGNIYSTKEAIDALMDVKGNFISKSVALSPASNENIANKSIEHLRRLRNENGIPHKIIAVACTIEHAKSIEDIYRSKGLRSGLIYHDLSDAAKEAVYTELDNDRLDVIVHVNMLGEGFDHKYLSIAAIFRPFRSSLPYEQFIGRILRRIDDNTATDVDNVGVVISHKYLNLLTLWQYYKKEKEKADIMSLLTADDPDWDINDAPDGDEESGENVINLAEVRESQDGQLILYEYMDTPTLQMAKEHDEKMENAVKALLEQFPNLTLDKAKFLVGSAATSEAAENRPDILYTRTKDDFNHQIKYVITIDLLSEFNLDPKGYELFDKYLAAFKGYQRKLTFINSKRPLNNEGMIPTYINTFLKEKIGKARTVWQEDDYKHAYELLNKIVPFLEDSLHSVIDK